MLKISFNKQSNGQKKWKINCKDVHLSYNITFIRDNRIEYWNETATLNTVLAYILKVKKFIDNVCSRSDLYVGLWTPNGLALFSMTQSQKKVNSSRQWSIHGLVTRVIQYIICIDTF